MSNELIPAGNTNVFLQSNFTFPDAKSAAVSVATREMSLNISKLTIPPSPASITFLPKSKSLEEKLFDATASVKVLSSKVAMHLNQERRNKLFSQIDSLHDIDEWDEEDMPVKDSSFETFLKAILLISPKRHPGLGLSHKGNLIATWGNSQDRLVAEFLPKGFVRFVLSRNLDGEIERATGETNISRLFECLTPYQPNHWFANE